MRCTRIHATALFLVLAGGSVAQSAPPALPSALSSGMFLVLAGGGVLQSALPSLPRALPPASSAPAAPSTFVGRANVVDRSYLPASTNAPASDAGPVVTNGPGGHPSANLPATPVAPPSSSFWDFFGDSCVDADHRCCSYVG